MKKILLTFIIISTFLLSTSAQLLLDPSNEPASTSLTFIKQDGQLVNNCNAVPIIDYYNVTHNPQTFYYEGGISYVYHQVGIRDSIPDSTYHLQMTPYGQTPVLPTVDQAIDGQYKNFFLEHCPDGITGVELYPTISYEQFMPGVSLHYHSNHIGLKTYLELDPYANPSDMLLQFDGQDSIDVDSNLLTFYMGNKQLILPPLAYAYEINSSNEVTQLTWVPMFSAVGEDAVEILPGPYNSDNTLVIVFAQPVPSTQSGTNVIGNMEWSTLHGESALDKGEDVATTSNGELLVLGNTASSNFPNIGTGVVQAINSGDEDCFVSKFDSDGVPKWTTFYGGVDIEKSSKVALGKNTDDIYFVGSTTSSSFPLANSNFSFNGYRSGFLVRISSDGQTKKYADFIGGINSSEANGLCLNSSDIVTVVGKTSSGSSFPIKSKTGAYNQANYSGGPADGFILQFDANNVQQWGTYFGTGEADQIYSVINGSNGSIRVAGTTGHNTLASANSSNPTCGVPFDGTFPDCDPGGLAYHSAYSGGFSDAFVAEFNSSGAMIWSSPLGGTSDESERVLLAGDGASDFYLACTSGKGWGSFSANNGGYSWSPTQNFVLGVGAIVRFKNNNQKEWYTMLGGELCRSGIEGIAADANGQLYVGGFTACHTPVSSSDFCDVPSGNNFPQCPGTNLFFQTDQNGDPVSGGGTEEGFIFSFSATDKLVWGSYYGSNSSEWIRALTVDNANSKERLFITGYSRGGVPIEDPGNGAYMQVGNKGSLDGLIGRFDVFGLNATGIQNKEISISDNKLLVFPNPASKSLNLIHPFEGQTIYCTVINSLGVKVMETTNTESINLSALSSGLYILQVSTQEQKLSTSFVIE